VSEVVHAKADGDGIEGEGPAHEEARLRIDELLGLLETTRRASRGVDTTFADRAMIDPRANVRLEGETRDPAEHGGVVVQGAQGAGRGALRLDARQADRLARGRVSSASQGEDRGRRGESPRGPDRPPAVERARHPGGRDRK